MARILKSNNFKNYTKVSLPENHCYLYSITTGGLSAAYTSAGRIRHISMAFAIDYVKNTLSLHSNEVLIYHDSHEQKQKKKSVFGI